MSGQFRVTMTIDLLFLLKHVRILDIKISGIIDTQIPTFATLGFASAKTDTNVLETVTNRFFVKSLPLIF